MKRKIYINGRFLTQRVTGVQRVAEEIVKRLDKKLKEKVFKDIEVILLVPKSSIRQIMFENIKVKSVGLFNGHIWEQFVLPLYTMDGHLINFCNTGPIFKKNQVVFIHDAAVFSKPEGYSKKFIYIYKLIYKMVALFTKKIITVSNFSKGELQSYLPSLRDKITPIYIGVDHMQKGKLDHEIFRKHNIQPGNYILAVGSMHPNKNFKVVIEALRKLENFNGQFVITGGLNNKVFSNEAIEVDSNILHVGYVSDEELKSLYQEAKAFIFPSVYEGFGLPPLEAMTFGCPVIAANSSSIPEVCGESPLYFNPYDSDSLVAQIKRIFNDDDLVQHMRDKGIEQSNKYRWDKTVNEFLKAIDISK